MTTSIGQRYVAFLKNFISDSAADTSHLFAPDVKKIVNSALICANREQLIEEMQDVHSSYHVKNIELLALIRTSDPLVEVVHFEISFEEADPEVAVTILKANEDGLIKEINITYGAKADYSWQPH